MDQTDRTQKGRENTAEARVANAALGRGRSGFRPQGPARALVRSFRMATRRFSSLAEALWLANTRYGSFGSPLGLVLAQDGGELRLRRLTATSSEVTMPYPAWAARPDNALCLPTALALADEISTFAGFALWDPRHRPGVSIALAGELVGRTHELPRVEPGEQPTREH